jgi:hypothetical protein
MRHRVDQQYVLSLNFIKYHWFNMQGSGYDKHHYALLRLELFNDKGGKDTSGRFFSLS